MEKNPLAKPKRLPESVANQRVRRRSLSEDEIACFLAAAEFDDEHHARRLAAEARIASRAQGSSDALLARLVRVPRAPLWRGFLENGARVGELTRVTWADVDVGRALLTQRAETKKAAKQRLVPLRAKHVGQLLQLRAVHERARGRQVQPGDRVDFTSPGRTSRANRTDSWASSHSCACAGIPKLSAQVRKVDVHTLRHTVAFRCARTGVSLIQAQRLLGHSDRKLTARNVLAGGARGPALGYVGAAREPTPSAPRGSPRLRTLSLDPQPRGGRASASGAGIRESRRSSLARGSTGSNTVGPIFLQAERSGDSRLVFRDATSPGSCCPGSSRSV
ncbi:MAG: site-specific integrase, partial [Planctomycetes bacterium]|nr:site-specific integrase [Planctomycetota bacterium]